MEKTINQFSMKNRIQYIILFLVGVAFVYACSKGSSDSVSISDGSGVGGSLARFTIVNDRLYSVDNQNLKVFNISDSSNVYKSSDSEIGWNIETISPGDSCLYIGSQNGMYVFDLKNPDVPIEKLRFQHIYSCDPVVSDGKYAYVTLSSTSVCGHSTNELQIYNVDPANPSLVTTYPMKSPKGLGLYNNVLYVCDNGKINVMNVSNPQSPRLENVVSISAHDVIPVNNTLIAVGDNILTQYEIQGYSLKVLSSIKTSN